MIKIIDFRKEHIAEAKKIALANYIEERAAATVLPEINSVDQLPCLDRFAENGLGAVMFDNEKMLGFLCCYDPWDNAFNTGIKGTFSPVHAHGCIAEDRNSTYKKLYQAAAKKWVDSGIISHAIALYAHDTQAVNAFFTCGFGLRSVDAIRSMDSLSITRNHDSIVFSELPKSGLVEIREMRRMLSAHLGESPCFMNSSFDVFNNWIKRAESRDSRVFTAGYDNKPVAFIETMKNSETFVSDMDCVINICGAFCMPEFRGRGIAAGLLDYVISMHRPEGYRCIGVDFESFNLTANGFWLRYFTAYTYGVVRRIDFPRT